MFGAGAATGPEVISFPSYAPWLASEKLHREFQVLGFYLSAHPLDTYNAMLAKMRVQNFADFAVAVKQGATRGPAGRHRDIKAGAQDPHRQQDGHRRLLGCLRPVRGGAVFRNAARSIATCSNPGKSLVMTVQAEERPEGIGLRIQTLRSLEEEALQQQKALRVYVRDSGPLRSIAAHLNAKGDGLVSFIVIKDDGQREIEVELSERYRISPEIAAALRSAPGVIDVEMV